MSLGLLVPLFCSIPLLNLLIFWSEAFKKPLGEILLSRRSFIFVFLFVMTERSFRYYTKKTCILYKNEVLISWMRDSCSSFFLTREFAAFTAYYHKNWENCWVLESGSLTNGTASVSEFAEGKQNYRKVDHFTTWLFGIFQKVWLFYPECLSQKIFTLFLPSCRVQVQLVLFRAFLLHWVVSKSQGWCFYNIFLLNSANGISVKPMFAEFKKIFFFTILFVRKRVWSFA